MVPFDAKGYAALLRDWVLFSQKHLYRCPDRPELICYGAGEHGHWGVHTHQKAFSAFAVAAVSPELDWSGCALSRETVLAQALAMLRYTLHTHLSMDFCCTDGKPWGHSWIYVLGMERMFHGVEALEAHLTDGDRAALRTVILSECGFLLHEYPVQAGLVENNKPESNLWNGAFLLRASVLYPDHPDREAWIGKGRQFLANGISIQSDENSNEVVDGCRVGDLFVGANMFDSYACNHHGYMNVGYMVICLSNIAMLHFFLKGRGVQPDAMLYHHLYEQWRLINSCTFDDGRLWRIGGDTRARYCYCQDYALPMWALIEDVFGEDCSDKEAGWLGILRKETAVNGDGSFLSTRFGGFEARSPVYYTRLESDRANVISMALYWHARYDLACEKKPPRLNSWSDEYHGAVLCADGNRYASFVWRAAEKPQALLVPRDDSSLAEWRCNLCGRIQGVGRLNDDEPEAFRVQTFQGGFLTCGSTLSFSDDFLAEGQKRETMARKHIAFAALPDQHTVLCLQHAQALHRFFAAEIRGILWNVPNDLFNQRQRTLFHPQGVECLRGGDFAIRPETLSLGNCVNVGNQIGLASAQPLTLVRSGRRQIDIKGRADSGTLYAEEICAPYSAHPHWRGKGEVLIDAEFAMSLGDWSDTQALSRSLAAPSLPGLKAVSAMGRDGKRYLLAANFGTEARPFEPETPGTVVGQASLPRVLAPGEAVLLCLG